MEGKHNFERANTAAEEGSGFDVLTEVEFAGAKENLENAISANEQYLDEMDDAYYEWQADEKVKNYNSENMDRMHDAWLEQQGIEAQPSKSGNDNIQEQWDNLEDEMNDSYAEYVAQKQDEEELQSHLEAMGQDQDEFSGERNVNSKTGKERTFSEMDVYARRKGQTSREYGAEMSRRHDLTILTDLFPKNSHEDTREYSRFITKIHDLMPRNEGESPDKYAARIERVFKQFGGRKSDIGVAENSTGTTKMGEGEKAEEVQAEEAPAEEVLAEEVPKQEVPAEGASEVEAHVEKTEAPSKEAPVEDVSDQESAAEAPSRSESQDDSYNKDYKYKWNRVLQDSNEMRERKNDRSVLIFLTSADGGFFVKKSEAIDSFIERAKNAETVEEFSAVEHLGRDIDYNTKDFSAEDLEKKKAYMATPEFQKKVCNYNIQREKKNIERKNDALKRCEDALAREQKGGFFRRLFNRRAIREARDKVEWTKRGIQESQSSLIFYVDKLKAINEGVDTDSFEYPQGNMAA